MTNSIKEFSNLLVIRNHLAKIPESQLIKIYSDYDYYLAFLNCVWLLAENDSAFLLFDESFIEKILSVIQIHRFDAKDVEVKDEINSIVEYANSIKSYSSNMRNTLKNNYLAYQESLRGASFYSTAGLVDSLAYDAIVLSALKDDKMDEIKLDEHYLLSLNYLMNSCPELFNNDEIYKRAIKHLEQVKKNTKLISKKKLLIKQTKTKLEKINQKEE